VKKRKEIAKKGKKKKRQAWSAQQLVTTDQVGI
jgi:hypothetical protein